MDFLSSIARWISDSESLLSGGAAIIVLLSVVVSGIGLLVRRLRRNATGSAQKAQPEVRQEPQPEPRESERITLRQLSAPSPFPVQFAESDGLKIAFNVQGDGPPDVVMAPGIISNLNISSHFPAMRDAGRAISDFARVVSFDKRGQGLSDPCLSVPTLEQRVHDIEAVMNAAGLESAVLYGISEGGAMCIKFAHDHPERVKGLVLLGSTASWLQREDFPIGLPEKALDGMVTAWGSGSLRDVFFPSIRRDVMDDDTYRGFERLIANRDSIRQLVEYMKKTDVRPLLPGVRCPALIVHFGGDLSVPVRMGRALAGGLPNAEFLEISGIDHADLSQSDEGVQRVREFVLGL